MGKRPIQQASPQVQAEATRAPQPMDPATIRFLVEQGTLSAEQAEGILATQGGQQGVPEIGPEAGIAAVSPPGERPLDTTPVTPCLLYTSPSPRDS